MNTSTNSIANNTPLASLAIMVPAQIKAIKNAIGGDRVIFSTHEEAMAKIAQASAATSEFFGAPLLFGPNVETADQVAIATLGTRAENAEGKNVNGIKAIMVFAIPNTEAFMSEAPEWIAKLVEREAADSIFGNLRGAATYGELVNATAGIASTVSDIVAESRNRSSLDTATFDAIWLSYRNDYLKAEVPALEKALPSKPIVMKAMRSASFSAAHPECAELEAKGMFAKVLASLIKQAKAALGEDGKPLGLDTTALEGWLENRASVHLAYTAPTAKEIGDIDAELDF